MCLSGRSTAQPISERSARTEDARASLTGIDRPPSVATPAVRSQGVTPAVDCPTTLALPASGGPSAPRATRMPPCCAAPGHRAARFSAGASVGLRGPVGRRRQTARRAGIVRAHRRLATRHLLRAYWAQVGRPAANRAAHRARRTRSIPMTTAVRRRSCFRYCKARSRVIPQPRARLPPLRTPSSTTPPQQGMRKARHARGTTGAT